MTQGKIRFAIPSDLDALSRLDKEATRLGLDRSGQIAKAISEYRCHVMAAGLVIQGFTIRSPQAFQGMDFLDLIVVAPEYRGQKIATSLLAHFSEMSDSAECWTSTNQSNIPMISLLRKLQWCESDHIEELDEGDPELFFYIK